MEVIITNTEGENVARSEAQKRADKKYQKKSYDRISIVFRKEDRIRELIRFAGKQTSQSANEYMSKAILSQLAHDGITIDKLFAAPTPPLPEPKPPKVHCIYLITSTYTPKPYEPEEYVAIYQTYNMAVNYINNKFSKKAHPDDWVFNLYSYNIEADTKLQADRKLKQIAKEAIRLFEGGWKELDLNKDNGSDLEDFDLEDFNSEEVEKMLDDSEQNTQYVSTKRDDRPYSFIDWIEYQGVKYNSREPITNSSLIMELLRGEV